MSPFQNINLARNTFSAPDNMARIVLFDTFENQEARVKNLSKENVIQILFSKFK